MLSFFSALVNDTSFWAMLSTLLCFALIAHKAKGPVLGALDSRANTIRERLDEAEKLHTEAQAILDEYKLKSERAIHEAEDILRNAERRAAYLHAESEAKLADMIARQELLAKNRIARLQEEAMQAIKSTVMAEMAAKIQSDIAAGDGIPPRLDHSLSEVAKILQK